MRARVRAERSAHAKKHSAARFYAQAKAASKGSPSHSSKPWLRGSCGGAWSKAV